MGAPQAAVTSLSNTMAPVKLTVMLFSVIGVHAGKKQTSAVASFSNGNELMEGHVTMQKGRWTYSLSIKDQAGLEEQLEAMDIVCNLADTPLNFHIHDDWTYGDDKSFGVGTECGGEYTGGHYKTFQDPTCVFDATWPELPEDCDEEAYPQD